MENNWKIIKSFPNYEASDQGFIRNAKTGRVLKPQLETKSGHSHVRLYRETITGTEYSQFKVHRIIADLFVDGQTEEENEILFKDGNKQNFAAKNLEWVSRMSINKRIAEQSKVNPYTQKRYRYAKPCIITFKDGTEKYYESRTMASFDIGMNINTLNNMVKVGNYSPTYKCWARPVIKGDINQLTWDEMSKRINQLEKIIKKYADQIN
jgi:hypothetical protein